MTGAVFAVLGSVYLFTLSRARARNPRLTFKQGEQYYTEPVTTAKANGVGELLMQPVYFNDDKATSVYVGQEEGAYQLKFVINPSRIPDPEVKAAFLELNSVI